MGCSMRWRCRFGACRRIPAGRAGTSRYVAIPGRSWRSQRRARPGGSSRILYRLRLSEFAQATLILGAVGLLLAFTIHVWLPAIGGVLLLLGGSLVWWQGTYLAGCVQEAVENSAAALGLSPFTPEDTPRRKRGRRSRNDHVS